MATNNLTPELLARIRAYYAQPTSGSGWSPNMATPYSEDGQVFQQDDGFFYNYDPNKQEAFQDKFNVYNQDGTFSNEGTFKTDDAAKTFMMMLAAAGGMAMLPAAGAGAGGGGYGALGATEPIASIGATGGMTQAELAAMGAGGGGVTSASLGATYGKTAADLAAMAEAGMTTAEISAATGLSAAEMSALGAASAAGGMGITGAGGAGGLLSGASKALGSTSSLLDGAGKYLGPAATLLGAAAGAKPQKTSETSVKSMDPRMDALFYGDLAPRIQGLLAKQMQPGAMQGFTDMQNVGRGLLNQPVAGNGFNRFFPGR